MGWLLSILKRPAWLRASRMITGRRDAEIWDGSGTGAYGARVGVEHRNCSAEQGAGFFYLILILSPAAKTLSWSNGQRRGYHYRLAAPAIIQNVNKPAIIRT